ncbi:hypothetical protein DERP_010584 [Dermatophagoides pteronyssinus]|uniref:Uncharacterized protein n=1 Tax=Dermatophagoides pteronyssinus TaxID=6956 RepID=A0ABQ8JFQ6_DERPT|nr:hypothetical protein DERP_010584 [Dermatophagoides pteronyssinus]
MISLMIFIHFCPHFQAGEDSDFLILQANLIILYNKPTLSCWCCGVVITMGVVVAVINLCRRRGRSENLFGPEYDETIELIVVIVHI